MENAFDDLIQTADRYASTPETRAAFSGSIFHAWMVPMIIALFTVTAAGAARYDLGIAGESALAAAYVILAVLTLVTVAVLWETGHTRASETVLLLAEAVALRKGFGPLAMVVARAGSRFPLADQALARFDHACGVSVPAVAAWARSAPLGRAAILLYPWLSLLLAITLVLPLVAGRRELVRVFLAANVAAFAMAYPVLCFFPAVGPWYAFHTTPTAMQNAVETSLLALRQPGPRPLAEMAIVSLPSFHACWAVQCAVCLWSFRSLRLPLAVVSGLIVFSTLATGWHYFADVIAGVLLAALSMIVAYLIANRWDGGCAGRR